MEIRNGSYIQTIAEMMYEFIKQNKDNNPIQKLEELKDYINKGNPNKSLEEINNHLQQIKQDKTLEELNRYLQSLSANTISNTITLNSIKYLPQETITIVSDSKIPTKVNYSVSVEKKYIKPNPRIIKITNQDLKERYCGINTNNSKYVECARCIDNQILNNPNSTYQDFNYCKIKKGAI